MMKKNVALFSIILLLICSSVFALSLYNLKGSSDGGILSFFGWFRNFFERLFGGSRKTSSTTTTTQMGSHPSIQGAIDDVNAMSNEIDSISGSVDDVNDDIDLLEIFEES
ncbi:MAG: hypothetical protein ISS48_03215 [Candidatus Aenigmarchaeota archaeon]|nr:hypothetical protein [Candidatus Aenigmarchaeota archaeon]